MNSPILFNPKQHTHLLPQLVTIHMRCITEPTYTVATFLPPLNQDTMTAWWEDRVKEVEKGEREIFTQLAPMKEGEEVVVAVVMLEMPFAETGPFRGVVQKLLVLPEYRYVILLAPLCSSFVKDEDWYTDGKLSVNRKMGIAKRMMRKLEEVAKERGRGLLVSVTKRGGGEGWERVLMSVSCWIRRRGVRLSMCILGWDMLR